LTGRVDGSSTRAVNSGSGNRALLASLKTVSLAVMMHLVPGFYGVL